MNKPKVIIFAHPRTGSNTLLDILNLHPSLTLMREPFNDRRDQWEEGNKNYLKDLDNGTPMNEIMEDIEKDYNGFKTLSYQLGDIYNNELLTSYDCSIIFLYRKNQLRSAVSGEIAKQTKIWQAEDKEKHASVQELSALDIEKIKEVIEVQYKEINQYRNILKDAQIKFMEITYEDLFEVSDDAKLKKTEDVFSFLGLELPNVEDIEKLTDSSRRITNDEIYNMIPNLQAVKELEDEETGYLFS